MDVWWNVKIWQTSSKWNNPLSMDGYQVTGITLQPGWCYTTLFGVAKTPSIWHFQWRLQLQICASFWNMYFHVGNHLEPQTTIYKWLFQLDDEPNLYIENGCCTKQPFINGCLGFQATVYIPSLPVIPVCEDRRERTPKNLLRRSSFGVPFTSPQRYDGRRRIHSLFHWILVG